MAQNDSASYHDAARALLARARPVDAHADTIGYVLDEGYPFAEGGDRHLDHPRLSASGFGTQVLTCWNEPEHSGVNAFSRASNRLRAASHSAFETITPAPSLDRAGELSAGSRPCP